MSERTQEVEVSDQVKKKWVEEKRRLSEKKQRRKGREERIEHFFLIS